jgi:aryl-alcohol dehydrogenase-like predicted oxidoreductase
MDPGRDPASPSPWTRRAVLGAGLAVGAGFAMPRAAAGEPEATPAALPKRPFGRTGREVSVFGLGCFYVGGLPEAQAVAVVQRAIDLGCTYVDTAPSYFGGGSESRVGKALLGRRDRVFLSTKTLERTATGAQRDLEGSLQRLRTDVIDMVQVHCVRDAADLASVLSERGPLAALERARAKGQVRFIGVTGHEDPAVVKTALESWDWASVLMPLNPVDAHWKSFAQGTLPAAVKKGLARVAMKVFSSGRLLSGDGALAAEECLRFAYGLDVSCAVVGCANVSEVELAAKVAADGKPLEPARASALVEAARRFSGKTGTGVEWYKHA